MSILDGAKVTRSFNFSDIQTGDVFWLTSDRQNPHHCLAEFGPLNKDGFSRGFLCLNGGWRGTLIELQDEGALEIYVHHTGSRFLVYIAEKAERNNDNETDENEVAF